MQHDVTFCAGRNSVTLIKCIADSNVLMCLHEPATPHLSQDYSESSGFQNCRWGLRYYLLYPNHAEYFSCRLQGHTAYANLSVKCIRQQKSVATGLPLRKSYSHLTHDVNLFRENQYCPHWSRWRRKVFPVMGGGLEDVWLFPLMKDFFPYAVKTVAHQQQGGPLLQE